MPGLKPIAFYLPQFHPIPENDRNWGTGFTEWTNVVRAQPQFPGHEQPHLPGELGFYDLRLPEIMEQQAALARQYGVHGFCYYHYWFNGRLLLERPLHQMLDSGRPDFPFCLCWANENWTRRWDGGDTSILFEQHYDAHDDREHFRYLLRFLQDPRYIRIAGKPLLLMYRSELHPDPAGLATRWREEAQHAGLPGLVLARVENFKQFQDPRQHGFDAGVEFAPRFPPQVESTQTRQPVRHALRRLGATLGLPASAHLTHHIMSMHDVAAYLAAQDVPDYPRLRCVTPCWDNTARRRTGAHIFVDSDPALFERWTRQMAGYTRQHLGPDLQFLFVNAWNEWAEGCHLEPSARHGRAYLEALQRALA